MVGFNINYPVHLIKQLIQLPDNIGNTEKAHV